MRKRISPRNAAPTLEGVLRGLALLTKRVKFPFPESAKALSEGNNDQNERTSAGGHVPEWSAGGGHCEQSDWTLGQRKKVSRDL